MNILEEDMYPLQGMKRKYSRGLRNITCMRIDGEIGSGTFGTVYKAIDNDSNSLVALKKIKMEKEKEGFPLTAIREIKILKALKHEHIIELKDVIIYNQDADKGEEMKRGFLDGDVFMVFELCEFDMKKLLDSPVVKFSDIQIKSYMKQLLTGMDYMHTNKILHRDIKSQNLFITRNNVLKIGDLGLARSSYSSTRRFTVEVCTLWYRSVELLLGTTNYGPEIDIWSIGCMFGEMKTRKAILAGRLLSQPGDSQPEVDQLKKVYELMGSPTDEALEELKKLPNWEKMEFTTKYEKKLRNAFKDLYDEKGIELLENLLDLNPRTRITASKSLDMDYFWQEAIPSPHQLPPLNVQEIEAAESRMKADRQKRLEEEQKLKEQKDNERRGLTIGKGKGPAAGTEKFKIIKPAKKTELG